MTPSLLRGRRILAAAAALPLLLLAACGEDADAGDSPAPAVPAPAEDAASEGSADGAEDLDAALDQMDTDTKLDVVGDTVVSVLNDAMGYEIDGSVLYVDVEGGSSLATSDCQIVSGAASAVVDDPQVVLRYDDGDVDCGDVLG